MTDDPTRSTAVLTIGLHPDLPGPLSAAVLRERLGQAQAALAQRGVLMDSCFLMLDESDEVRVRTALGSRAYACVCIGAGLRFAPQHTVLFECVVNAVQRWAPQARLCFNASPDDVLDAVLRCSAR